MNPPISQVYLMDCMDLMKQYPDKHFDLAIVDPPYGIGEDGGRNNTRGSAQGANKFKGTRNTTGKGIPSTKFAHKEWDNEPPPPEYFEELRRVSKNQIIWGANHFISRIPMDSPCWIVWDKNNGTTDFADCELAWTSFPTAVRKFTFTWNGMLQGNMALREKRIHPTQKPVALYHWLLQNYAKAGDTILDTHLGSGSHRIAAYKLGFHFVGCEREQDYFEAQEKRFQEAIREPLFDSAPIKLEQGSMFG
jgi:site-specific DNA-methyltransferase (adenine-specific)